MRDVHEAAAEPGKRLRDVDRWKDKIEIRLDNRQVAFLFFGSALIGCLLFILGVVVGKRLESRGHALAPDIEDPLALLDRVAEAVPNAPRALGNVAISRAHAAPAPKPRIAAPAPVKPAVAPMAKPEGKPIAAKPPAPEPVKLAAAPEPTKAPPRLPATALAAVAPSANPELLPPATLPAVAAAPSTAAGAPKRFMLQVGSFLDRAEAEAFAASLGGLGANIITSEIPGKGTWFRVRVGDYRAFEEAVKAKLSFEKRYSKIALVVGPL